MDNDQNPFASPAPTSPADRPPTTGDAKLLKAGYLFRRIQLPAPSEAIIEYSGRGFGYDVVRVNGHVVAWDWKWVWFVHRFDFTAPLEAEPKPAVLTVEVGYTLKITRLTIEVDDRLLYEEVA